MNMRTQFRQSQADKLREITLSVDTTCDPRAINDLKVLYQMTISLTKVIEGKVAQLESQLNEVSE